MASFFQQVLENETSSHVRCTCVQAQACVSQLVKLPLHHGSALTRVLRVQRIFAPVSVCIPFDRTDLPFVSSDRKGWIEGLSEYSLDRWIPRAWFRVVQNDLWTIRWRSAWPKPHFLRSSWRLRPSQVSERREKDDTWHVPAADGSLDRVFVSVAEVADVDGEPEVQQEARGPPPHPLTNIPPPSPYVACQAEIKGQLLERALLRAGEEVRRPTCSPA